MDNPSLLRRRNQIKATGSAALFFGTVFADDPNTLLIEGPGVLTAAFIIVAGVCIALLALYKRDTPPAQ